MRKKEGEYIRALKPSLNIRIAGRTTNEYYIGNKEYLRERHKKWHLNNKEYSREYYQTTKEMVTCECGCEITKRGLKQHIETKKHQHLMP